MIWALLRTPYGMTVAACLAAALAFAAWDTIDDRKAVRDAEIKRQAEERQKALNTLRRIEDATSQGGTADDIRERIERMLSP